MWCYQAKHEPYKIILGAPTYKLLEVIVTFKGIYLDLDKVRTIQEMKHLKNLKELCGLQG